MPCRDFFRLRFVAMIYIMPTMKKLILASVAAIACSSCSQMYWPASEISTDVKITTFDTLKKGSVIWIGEKDAKNSMMFVTQKDAMNQDELFTLHFPESMRGKKFYVHVYEGLQPKGEQSYVQPKAQGSFTVGKAIAYVLDGEVGYSIYLSRLFGCIGAPQAGFSPEMMKALMQRKPED